MIAACEQARELATQASGGLVDDTGATRLVGRICNLPQVEPALRRPLQGGYRITRASG